MRLCLCFCTGKYHDLERQLIQEFTAAQRRGEIGRMREVAAVLLHFKVTNFLSAFVIFNVINEIVIFCAAFDQ